MPKIRQNGELVEISTIRTRDSEIKRVRQRIDSELRTVFERGEGDGDVDYQVSIESVEDVLVSFGVEITDEKFTES